jgi:hypothetical protein
MPVAWNDDPAGSEARIAANIRAVGTQIYAEAHRREHPSFAIAQGWHRAIYAGVPLSVPYYAGEIRDSDRRFPELVDYEVQIGRLRCVPAAQVPAALADLETRARNAVTGPDAAIFVGRLPATPLELRSVLLLAANPARRMGTHPPIRQRERAHRTAMGHVGGCALPSAALHPP